MHKSFIFGRKFPGFLLCGLLGLLLGIPAAAAADDSFLLMMRQAAVSPVSIVVLLPVCLLPFLIAAYAVSIDQWHILFFTAFLRFFCWSYCAGMSTRAFGTAAWLIQPMLQFSDGVTLVLFCLFGVRWCGGAKGTKWDALYALILVVLTVITDALLVSPYLAKLF